MTGSLRGVTEGQCALQERRLDLCSSHDPCICASHSNSPFFLEKKESLELK